MELEDEEHGLPRTGWFADSVVTVTIIILCYTAAVCALILWGDKCH